MIALVLLTIFGGAIRFWNLRHPSLWYDESMVFRRTCGSYGQLLDCLRTDGFVPLHYSLVWVISRVWDPTPVVLRLFPALCGTLMIPAIYFLARQMLPRGTALLAAAFAACSAFTLFYSRDAKMYMDAWLFVALNCGCLLWWFRSALSTAWLCWIASGCAACGIHFSSICPIAVSLLLLFTQRTMRWQQAVLWVIGFAVIVSGPAGYYEKFNRWEDRVNDDGWRDSGLDWIQVYNQGRTGPQLVRFLATTMLMGWEWPKEDLSKIPSARVERPSRAAEVIGLILVACCLPWHLRWGTFNPVLRYAEAPDPTCKNPALRSTLEPAWQDRQPQWRVALWLGLWILIPVYGFYCRSMTDFASPAQWGRLLMDPESILNHVWLWVLAGLLVAAMVVCVWIYPGIRQAVLRCLALTAVFISLLGVCQLIVAVMAAASSAAADAGKPWQSMWVPRYIGFIWPMLAVTIAALLMRLPTMWVRVPAIIFVLGLNLGIASFRIFGDTEPPVDRMAADAVQAQKSAGHDRFWAHLAPSRDNPGGANLFGEPGQYYLDIFENKPTDPLQFHAAVQASRRTQLRQFRIQPWTRGLSPNVDRIILWSQYDSDNKPIAVETNPPPEWNLESEEWFTARDCWIWQDLAKYRRRVYIKNPPPATAPVH